MAARSARYRSCSSPVRFTSASHAVSPLIRNGLPRWSTRCRPPGAIWRGYWSEEPWLRTTIVALLRSLSPAREATTVTVQIPDRVATHRAGSAPAKVPHASGSEVQATATRPVGPARAERSIRSPRTTELRGTVRERMTGCSEAGEIVASRCAGDPRAVSTSDSTLPNEAPAPSNASVRTAWSPGGTAIAPRQSRSPPLRKATEPDPAEASTRAAPPGRIRAVTSIRLPG